MLEIVGIVSAVCMTISSIPQAWSVYKKGSAEELSMATQLLWLVGEVCYMVYIWPMQNAILLMNCIPPLVCIFTTIYYKLFPRKISEQQEPSRKRVEKEERGQGKSETA